MAQLTPVLTVDAVATRPRASGPLKRILRLARTKPLGTVAFIIILIYWCTAALAPWIARTDYNEPLYGPPFHRPNAQYWLGTDDSGRDVFSRVVWASRTDLLLSFMASFIGVGMAFTLGVLSGYLVGWFDLVVQRLVDGIQALPGLILLLVITAVFGTELIVAMAAISILSVPVGLRIFRSSVLQIRQTQYVEAARVVGASHPRILLNHVAPNVLPLAIIVSTLALGVNVLLQSSLAFLGLVSSSFPSWGTMLNVGAITFMEQAPWLALAPGLAISGIVFSYSMFGDALRDVLDPRLRVGS
jgi:peptide/nickel transport system permease protein